MEKNKNIFEKAKDFVKKYYDYIILFILLSWSTYVEYWSIHNFIKWSDLPCMLIELNSLFLGGVGFQYYQIFGKSIGYTTNIIITSFLFFLGYFLLKYFYNKIKIKWLKVFLLILFYLYIIIILLSLYVRCSIISMG